MAERSPDPRDVALWRHGVIEEALGVPRDLRGKIVKRIARAPVRWPSGASRRVSAATIYRWIEVFEEGGLAALRPVPQLRKAIGKACLPDEVVEKARGLLADDPELTFTLLISLLEADPEVQATELKISRSTLQRRLAADVLYQRLKRARKRERERGRFVAREPHGIWHLDAKGPAKARLRSGGEIEFHVLTVLDDASRSALAWLIVKTPDLAAAIGVFRLAAERWGLPDRIYIDRASIFDTPAFREGLAELGVHRIFVKARNPQANGKIEAFHRTLQLWFFSRLKKQVVIDLKHLEELFDAVIEFYQDHRHRGLAASPRVVLGGRVSRRFVPPPRLYDAFREERMLKTHKTTGEVDIGKATWLVPEHLRDRRLAFRIDRDPRVPPIVVEPGTGRHLPLERAKVHPDDALEEPKPVERWAAGPLQTLYDAFRGKVRKVAEPGFGLPEIFELLGEVAGRLVPKTDAEAALVQQLYREIGPLARKPAEAALWAIGRDLGQGRPLGVYLDVLARKLPKTGTIDPTSPKQKPWRKKP